jgi:hypothetical protein
VVFVEFACCREVLLRELLMALCGDDESNCSIYKLPAEKEDWGIFAPGEMDLCTCWNLCWVLESVRRRREGGREGSRQAGRDGRRPVYGKLCRVTSAVGNRSCEGWASLRFMVARWPSTAWWWLLVVVANQGGAWQGFLVSHLHTDNERRFLDFVWTQLLLHVYHDALGE